MPAHFAQHPEKKLDGTNHALVAAVKNSKNAAVQIGKTIGDQCFNVVRLQFWSEGAILTGIGGLLYYMRKLR